MFNTREENNLHDKEKHICGYEKKALIQAEKGCSFHIIFCYVLIFSLSKNIQLFKEFTQ